MNDLLDAFHRALEARDAHDHALQKGPGPIDPRLSYQLDAAEARFQQEFDRYLESYLRNRGILPENL